MIEKMLGGILVKNKMKKINLVVKKCSPKIVI